MLTDEQFAHRLGAQLHQETMDVQAPADLARTIRRQATRRTWTIRTTIATSLAATAATAILVATSSPNAPGVGPQPNNAAPPTLTSSSPVQVENVAYVQEQTLKALSQASQYVIYAKDTYQSGHYDEWIDKATQRYRNDVYTTNAPASSGGKIHAPPPPSAQTPYPLHLSQSHAVSGPLGNQDVVTVDYDIRKWFTSHDTHKGPITDPIITDADSVRKAMTDGTLELLGHEKVNGLDTLHLQLYGPKRSYRIDMWVDSKTYLPVQEIAAKSTGNEFPASAAVTTTYTWLPRTEENLAKLTLTPPPDFQQLQVK